MFCKYVLKSLNLKKTDILIAAISGGADSMCLAHILKNQNQNFIIAHFNHNLRNSESEQEAKLVENYAKKLNIHFETKEWSFPPKKTSENQARIARYNFLKEIKEKHKAKHILTAHHANDQVETVLLHFIRGSGLKGLCGIKIINKDLIRPLLKTTKTEILEYVKKNNIPFIEASDNSDLKYSRNLIRHKIIPTIKQINPNFTKTILKSIPFWAETDNFITTECDNWIKKNVLLNEKDQTIINLSQFKKLHPVLKRKIIQNFLPQTDIYSKNLQEISDFLDHSQTGKYKILAKTRFEIQYQNIVITTITKPVSKKQGYHKIKLVINGVTKLPTNEIITTKLNSNQTKLNLIFRNQAVTINYNPLTSPKLLVRSWKAGDRFTPKGMTGSQKIQDFFVNKKIPREERHILPIIINDKNKIIWILIGV